jgi:hypothetical protein
MIADPSQYSLFSGGAKGADTVWHICATKYGIRDISHYREPWAQNVDSPELRRMGVKPTRLTYDEMEIARPHAITASIFLERSLSASYSHYQIRNWFQVLRADAVFAVSELEQDMERVKGGTGYAIEYAKMQDKPAFIFDQQYDAWFQYDPALELFTPCAYNVPMLTPKFAGVGTRDITDSGRHAIEEVLHNTFRL